MLFWIFVAIMVIAITVCIVSSNNCNDTACAISAVAILISVLTVLIMGGCIIFANVNVEGQIARHATRYDMLTYQYENDVYENDNDIGKRELMEDIQSWNEDLANYKAVQDNFWIGIFYPNIYDAFEFIELK